MPTTPLSSALKTKQKELKLTVTKLAKAIGVGVQSVSGVLKGTSVPNASTAKKYAKFLGLPLAKFTALAKPVDAKPVGKTKGKGRKKAKAVVAVKPAKVKGVTLSEAVDLAADALAVATHRATAQQRRIIAAVVK